MSDRPQLKVVQIRDGAPLLNDIPAQLRRLADDIENGKLEPLEFLMVAGRNVNGFTPFWAGFGNNPDRHTTAGFFMHLAQRAITDAEPD